MWSDFNFILFRILEEIFVCLSKKSCVQFMAIYIYINTVKIIILGIFDRYSILILSLKCVFVFIHLICKSNIKRSVLLNAILKQMFRLPDKHQVRMIV
jgi:hypothetical protein